MRKLWWRIYEWPKKSELFGTAFYSGLFGRCSDFYEDETKAHYKHIAGRYFVRLVLAFLISTNAFAVDYRCKSDGWFPAVWVTWHETSVDTVDVSLDIWRVLGFTSYRFDDSELLRPDQYTGRIVYETGYDNGQITIDRRYGTGTVEQDNGLSVKLVCQ